MQAFPDFWPVGVEEVPAPSEYRLVLQGPGAGYVPIQKLNDGRLALDWWQGRDGPMVKAWRKADHPNMALLPPHTPRTVKRLFRAEFQLFMLRMTDNFEFSRAMRQAEADWQTFLSARRAA